MRISRAPNSKPQESSLHAASIQPPGREPALAGCANLAHTAGFALIEQNTSGLGNAYAGQAAAATRIGLADRSEVKQTLNDDVGFEAKRDRCRVCASLRQGCRHRQDGERGKLTATYEASVDILSVQLTLGF